MRILFETTFDENVKAQINLLEKAFRGSITTAVKRELNLLRRNGVLGDALLKNLARIYHQHNMRGWMDHRSWQHEEYPVPKIICSERLR